MILSLVDDGYRAGSNDYLPVFAQYSATIIPGVAVPLSLIGTFAVWCFSIFQSIT